MSLRHVIASCSSFHSLFDATSTETPRGRSPASETASKKRSSFADGGQGSDSKARRVSRQISQSPSQNNNNIRPRATSADDANVNNCSKRDLRPDDFEQWGSFNTAVPLNPDRSRLAFVKNDPKQRDVALERARRNRRYLTRKDSATVTRFDAVTVEQHTTQPGRNAFLLKNKHRRYQSLVVCDMSLILTHPHHIIFAHPRLIQRPSSLTDRFHDESSPRMPHLVDDPNRCAAQKPLIPNNARSVSRVLTSYRLLAPQKENSPHSRRTAAVRQH